MEIPFETITHTDFRNAGPGEGLASFHLSQPPNFFLEHILSPRSSGIYGTTATMKTWKKCADWTEGTQASRVMRHDLIGSAVQLAHLLNDLREFRSRSGISLLSPGAYGAPSMLGVATSSSPTAVQIPQPPLVGLHSQAATQKPPFLGHSRKRSNSGPPAMVRPPYAMSLAPNAAEETESGVAHPYSAGYASTSFSGHQPDLPSYSYGQQQRVGSEFIPTPIQTTMEHSTQDQNASNLGLAHRPYSSTPISTQFFSPTAGEFQAPTHVQSPHNVTPSPPILSPPFGPDTSLSLSGIAYFGSTGQGQHRSSPTYEPGAAAGSYGSSAA